MPTSVPPFLAECTYAPKHCDFKPFAVYQAFIRSRKATCLENGGKIHEAELHCRGFFPLSNGLRAAIVTEQKSGLPIAIFQIEICLTYDTYLDYSIVVEYRQLKCIREIDWKQLKCDCGGELEEQDR